MSIRWRRREAERFAVLARYASDVVLILDTEGRMQYLSPSADRLMGYRDDEWLGRSAFDALHPDDLELAAASFQRTLAQTGLNVPLEMRVQKIGGDWRWFEVVATNLIDNPAIQGVVLCARDITERVEALESLKRNDERLNALLRHSSDVVLVLTSDGTLSYVSPSAPQLLGYPYGSHLGARVIDLVHPDDRARLRAALVERVSTEARRAPIEFRVAHADGTWREIELVATNRLDDPAVNGIVCNLRDLTDLRLAQGEVSASSHRSEAMLANLSDMVSVIDAEGRMTYVSAAAERLFGRLPEDRLGADILEFVHPDDTAFTGAQLATALAQPGILAPFETRVRDDAGAYRTFEVRANNLLDDPLVQGIIVSSRDISDRVSAEAALRASERLYRTIVETTDEGIWIIDTDAVTTFVNRRMAEMLGRRSDDMIGRPLFDFLDDVGRANARRNLERRRAGIAEQHDTRFVRPDGTSFWGSVTASPFMDDDGAYQGAIALITDVTERRQAEADRRAAELERHRHEAEIDRHRLEAELHQARRLESLGRLAAGVAHDFNNLIGVILNYSTAAAKQLDASGPVAADVEHIQQAAEQAAEVTRKLLVFGRADSVDPEVFDLNELIGSITQLVDRSFGEGIAVTTALTTGGCCIRADRGQIDQLVMNLLVNARDAVKPGGTITVTTTVEAAARRAGSSGDEVVMTVADDGAGMAPEVAARAFEPFFTTKSAEGGSGLGLATVHGIVARADGHVSIASEPSIGTSVTVRFPRHR